VLEEEDGMTAEKKNQDRASIATCGVDVKDIPGLINIERMDFTSPETLQWMMSQKRDTYPREEIFGTSCTVTEFIECPIEMAYEYATNVYGMEEWTATLRNFQYVGGGLYRADDVLAKDTPIYLRIEAHHGSHTIDYLCAWDQGLELWMRYFFRFIDASPAIGKPGTILFWVNCKHPYYDKNNPAPAYVAEPRARTDRLWVGEMWDLFYAAHHMEASNLKKILEHRFRAYETPERRAAK
jgi:hypothetical protein